MLTPLQESLPAATHKSVAGRFMRAAQLTSGAGVVARILQLLLPFLVARIIPRAAFGILTIINSTVAVGTELGQMGQTATVQKFVPQYAVAQAERIGALVSTIFSITLCCLTLMASALFLTSPWFAVRLYGDANLVNYLRIAAVLLMASGLFNILSGVLAGLQDFARYSTAQMARSALMFLLGVGGALVWGLSGVLAAQILGAVVVAWLIARLASKALGERCNEPLRLGFDRQFISMIVHFSIPVFLSALLVFPAYWLAMARLSRLFGMQEVAQFGIAFGVMQFVTLIPTLTSMTALSFLSESHTRGDHSFGGLANLNLRVAWLTALISALALSFLAPPLLHLVYGNKYGEMHWLLLFLLLGGMAISTCASVGSVIASIGKMWQALSINMVWLALFSGFAVTLIPRFAATGLALTYFASYGLFLILAVFYARRVCSLSLHKLPSLIFLTVLGFGSAAAAYSFWAHAAAWIGIPTLLLVLLLSWRMVLTVEERTATAKHVAPYLPQWFCPQVRTQRILYLCHVDWGWIKQRPQHLAEQLRRSFRVTVAFNYTWRRGQMQKGSPVASDCLPLLHLPLRGRMPLLTRIDRWLACMQVRLILHWVRPDHVWITWPEFIDLLPRRFSANLIYDCMDDSQAFPREAKRTAALQACEQRAIARAGVVFVASDHLRSALESRYGQCAKYNVLRNGLAGDLLESVSAPSVRSASCSFGYCGTIAQWTDWELLSRMVDAHPEVSIHLVGPFDDQIAFPAHPRIVHHPPVPHRELAAAMAQYDCLIMAFQVTPLIASVDPVKLYEYINFGKPILCVYYDEIARFAPFVHFYHSQEDALLLAGQLISGAIGRNYTEEQRRSFLLDSCWEKRAAQAVTVLHLLGKPCAPSQESRRCTPSVAPAWSLDSAQRTSPPGNELPTNQDATTSRKNDNSGSR
jgi:O-antigen/teichoic acid export membrane protein